MSNLFNLFLAVLAVMALGAPTCEAARRPAASAWNPPPRRVFGIRRRASPPNKPSFVVEPEAASDDAFMNDCPPEMEPLPTKARVLPSSARAAAVACVSAAAIGGARHAIEAITD